MRIGAGANTVRIAAATIESMPRDRVRIVGWIGLLALAATLVAFGCEKGSSSSGGAKSSILVYTAMEPDQVAPIIEAFRRDHPEIDATVVRDSTGVITARLLAEASAPRADVIWGLAATSLLV